MPAPVQPPFYSPVSGRTILRFHAVPKEEGVELFQPRNAWFRGQSFIRCYARAFIEESQDPSVDCRSRWLNLPRGVAARIIDLIDNSNRGRLPNLGQRVIITRSGAGIHTRFDIVLKRVKDTVPFTSLEHRLINQQAQALTLDQLPVAN